MMCVLRKIRLVFLLSAILMITVGNAHAFTPAPRFENGFSFFDGSTIVNRTDGSEITLGQYILSWTGDDAILTIPAELGGAMMGHLESGAVKNCDTITTVILPDSSMAIFGGSFRNCPNLETAIIHDKLRISSNPFVECPSLREFILDENAEHFGLVEGNLYDLKTMTLLTPGQSASGDYSVPEGTKIIAAMAYFGRQEAESVALPDGLLYIGSNAFDSCVNLQEITFPNTLLSIAPLAFYRCENLENLVLPPSLEAIGNGAFAGCSKLTSVEIPPSVSQIGITAFRECPNIQLTVEKGSYAEEWAIETGVACVEKGIDCVI